MDIQIYFLLIFGVLTLRNPKGHKQFRAKDTIQVSNQRANFAEILVYYYILVSLFGIFLAFEESVL